MRFPTNEAEEDACAKEILAKFARRAWRRPVSDSLLQMPLRFYREGYAKGGFEAGIELAVSAILVNPQFLFRIEQQPAAATSGDAYRISDIELASRLSFFLWSSIPDDELLTLAERQELHRPDVLKRQVMRMLVDGRAESLATNFAGQWLYLRNLDAIQPDMRLFPDFDHNLRLAMRRETELLFAEMVRENRSVLSLVSCEHSYLNERLAKHYGIPHVYGPRFRKVQLGGETNRGGLLRHSSILAVTSLPTRTSPVLRGQWILKNLLASPPPPPPDDVPALADNTVEANLPVRERLAMHRENEACARCHNLMDPVGLALENFDAIGRFRNWHAGEQVDVSGGLIGVGELQGVTGVEKAILARPELFVSALAEKLLTYALGRGVDSQDGPAVRKIVRETSLAENRFEELITSIVTSQPFLMRTAQ